MVAFGRWSEMSRGSRAFIAVVVMLVVLIGGAGFADVSVNITAPESNILTGPIPDLNITTNVTANITYNWNGEGNISGCRECNSYNTTYGEYANISDINLTAVWHFNENFGNTTFDDSPNGNDGSLGNATLAGTQPTWTTGKFGYALDFDGVNDYVKVPDSNSLDASSNITLSAWVKFPSNFSNYTTDYDLGLVDKGNYKLKFNHQSGRLEFELDNAAATSWSTSYSATSTQDILYALAAYNGKLYAGMGWTAASGDGDVLVYNGTGWSTSYDGTEEEIVSLAVYNGKLYAGQGVDTGDGDVLVYNGTGWNVNVSYDGSGSQNDRTMSLAVYNGKLYAGHGGATGKGDVWVYNGTDYPNGTGYWDISLDRSEYKNIWSLAVYDGKLYAGLGGSTPSNLGTVWVYNGTNWSVSYNSTTNSLGASSIYDRVESLAVYDGKLYAGTGGKKGEGDILVYNGTGNWSLSYNAPYLVKLVTALGVYNGKLYAGLGKDAGYADVMVYNGTDYSNGTGHWSISRDGTEQSIDDFAVYDGKLYAGQGRDVSNGDVLVYGNNEVLNSSINSWNADQWYHVAATYDGTDMKIYVNGTEDASKSVALNIETNVTPLYIGYDGANSYFNGTIDEIAIFNRTLSAAEISGVYNRTLEEGNHNVTVYAVNDSDGKVNSTNMSLTYDTTPPTWVLGTNNTNSTLAGNDTLFSLQVQDNVGLSYCYIATNTTGTMQNGSIITLSGNDTTCSQVITLNSTVGANITWAVWFNDTAGNVNSTGNFTITTTEQVVPTVTIFSPANATTSDNTPLLNATFDTTANYTWYNVNGMQNLSYYPDTSNLTLNLPQLSDGPHNVTVYANDSSGNLGSSIAYFTVDTTSPNVTINSPANDTITDNTLDINVTLNEDTGNVTAMINSSVNVSLTNVSGNWNYTGYIFSEGANNITIFANDSAGNMNSTEIVYFTVDTTPPTWVFATNNTNSTLAGNDTLFSLQVQDNVGLSYCYIATNTTGTMQNGSIITLSGNSASCNQTVTLNSTVGANITWAVWFNDTAGNVNSTGNFTITTTEQVAPTVTIFSPANATTSDNTPLLNATFDTTANYTWYNVNGTQNSSYYPDTSNLTLDLSQLSDGPHNVTVYANDSSGNLGSSIAYFTVDTTLPTFSSYARNPDPPNEDESVELNVTITETNKDTVILEFNNGTKTNYTVTTSSGDEYYFTIGTGNYTAHDSINYTWWANDTAGNANWSAQQAFTVANQVPTDPSLTAPTNTSYTSPTVTIDWTNSTDDDTEDTVSYWVFVDGTVNKSVAGANTTNIDFADGSHNVQVLATDDVGNSSQSAAVYFTVDTAPPTYSSVSRSSTEAGASTLFSAYWQDSVGLSGYIFSTNNSGTWTNDSFAVMTGTGSWSNVTKTLNSTAGIDIGWRIYANDTSDNWNDTGIQVLTTTDETPPTITIVSPTNDTYSTSTVDLNVSADETIDTWWYNLNDNTTANTTFTPNTTVSVATGSNKLIVYANDTSGNENSATVYFTSTISETNITQNVTKDINTTIDLRNKSKLVIELMPNANAIMNMTVKSSINASLLNITDLTASLGSNQRSLNRFTFINVSGIANNESGIKWVLIKLYYENSDLGTVNVNALKMYWYSENESKWYHVTSGLAAHGGPTVYGTGQVTSENYIWANLSHFSVYGVAGDVVSGGGPTTRDGGCYHRLSIKEVQVFDAVVGGTAVLSVTIENTNGCNEREILVRVSSLPSGWSADNRTIDIPNGSVDVNLTLKIPPSEVPGRRGITVELTPKHFIGAVRKDLFVGVKSASEAPVTTTTPTIVPPTTTTGSLTTTTTTVPPQTTPPPRKGICGPTAVLLIAVLVPVLAYTRRRSR